MPPDDLPIADTGRPERLHPRRHRSRGQSAPAEAPRHRRAPESEVRGGSERADDPPLEQQRWPQPPRD